LGVDAGERRRQLVWKSGRVMLLPGAKRTRQIIANVELQVQTRAED